jgi:hypothetical protein
MKNMQKRKKIETMLTSSTEVLSEGGKGAKGGKGGGKEGMSLISTVRKGKEPQEHARKRLMQEA